MTELIWDGKYKDGKKVTPVRIALPFQTIETVNESAQQRQKTLDFFASEPNSEFGKEWRNRLIWGDKKYVLPSLLPEFAGKVNLIYIDPPFNVGANFSFTATIPDHPETVDDETTSFVKEPSIIEQKAYRDTWGRGLDSYLQWFYETAILMRELLSEDGSIYVHLDWHVCQYAKVIMDEIFGYNNFMNEIIWCYSERGISKTYWNKKHDNIFVYAKNLGRQTFNPDAVRDEYKDEYLKKFKYKDEIGLYQIRGKNIQGSPVQKADGLTPEAETKYPGLTYRQHMKDGTLPLDWWEISLLNKSSHERVAYATQKPEALLDRIIKASSNKGDLILDCFCGSGTAAAVAEKLDRRWITCDLGRFAIHTSRKRFLGIENVKPFIVQNLGKYERQQWMAVEFHNTEDRLIQEKSYRQFIVDLYNGKFLDGYMWLHGAKAGKMIHVGNVEAPITVEDIKASIKEFWKMVGKEKNAEKNGIDFLGWDFAFDVNETAKQFAAENKVNVSFKKIPREVLEKKAVQQGDIKFYELAALTTKASVEKMKVTLTLDNFIIPQDDLPEDVRGSISHWSQWIDYWAVDWNFRDDTFHNEWQSYRTKQNPKIELSVSKTYDKKGKYEVIVKVIDILGNDTTKSILLDLK